MPLFGLKPVPAALDTLAWVASTYRGPCYVMAPDARRARLHAASRFADPGAAGTASGLLPASPWMLADVVALDLTFSLVDGMAPEGTIMVPNEAGDPAGAFRVLAAAAATAARPERQAPPGGGRRLPPRRRRG